MKGRESFVQRARRFVDAKLGRCPTCMRWSIVGSLLGWGVFAAERALWPNKVLASVALVVACGLSLLMISHIAVHVARDAVTLHHGLSNLPRRLPLSRRKLLTTVGIGGLAFALTSLLPVRLVRAATRRAREPRQQTMPVRFLDTLVALLSAHRVARDELFRIAAVAQVAQRSGLPFQFVWGRAGQLAALEQQGSLPTTVVNSQFQGALALPSGDSVTMEKFVPVPSQELSEFTLQNNCNVPIVVDGQAGELYFAKTLGPGDSLRVVDPAFLPILFIVVRYAAVGVAAACVVERVVVSIVRRQPVPCRLITGYTKCNECAGDCAPSTTCQGTSFSTCFGFSVEPDSCGCS